MKRILSFALAVILVFGMLVGMPVMASATGTTSIAKKTSTAIDEKGRFEIEIQVPGDDGREYHDEVIVMVDGSYSTDDDWATTRAAIVEIGKTVLEGNGNTLLTVMTFGMGDNIVLKHVSSVAELQATLTELPGGLLYGRSSTNCEAGFTGIAEYISSHDGTLNEVHVVYITDGEINTDETEYVFYNWTQNTWLKREPLVIATMSIEAEIEYYLSGETNLSNAYLTVFGDPADVVGQVMLDEEAENEEDEDETSEDEEGVTEGETPENEEGATEGETPENEEGATEGETPENEEGATEGETPENEEGATEGETPENEEGVTEGETPENEEGVTEGETPENEEGVTEGETSENEEAPEGETPENEEDVPEGETSEGEELVSEAQIPENWEIVTEDIKQEEISPELLASNGNYEIQLLSATTIASDEDDDDVISEEEAMAWAAQVWKDVYEYSGMNPDSAYPVSDVERAFVRYDKENGTHVQEMFYYALWGRGYPDKATRTPAAGLALAANGKVAHLYMVDSNGATSWMSGMASSASNVSFYVSGSVSNLLVALDGVLTNLAYTPYNDVVVTDYMSKWVELDSTTIKIVDNYSGMTIWNNVEGWLISENRPTSQVNPVHVEEVPAAAYGDGGPNVVGNENGTIYKLTWYVKDGAMLRNHNYSLVYEVDVDTKETGFKYNTNYPANGNTTIDYTEKNGDEITEITEDIPVPNVIVNRVETVSVRGVKTWEDEENKNQTRPESITVNLLADGTKVDSKVVTANDKWTYSFVDVPKYNADDSEIVYTVSEDEVANYESTVDGYNITNTYVEPETIDVRGIKTWEDEENKNQTRPESITINLLADGTKVDSKVVTANDDWSYSFENVVKYNEEGKEIVYTVSEDEVPNYKATVNGYNITNTYVETEPPAPETIDVRGIKIWEDEGNKYGKRPECITVNLMADGTKVDSKVVTAADNWSYSFEKVAKYNAEGKEIVYTVSENKVADYVTKISGYNITNTYVKPEPPAPETVNVSGSKTWKDEGNKYGKRPESITINLLANGKKVLTKVVTAKDNWKYSFNNLPKYDADGKQIVYTVTENKVANYKTTISGYDVVNTYKKPIFYFGDNPKTGDYIYTAVVTAAISGGLLILLLCLNKKNKKKK